MRLSELDIDRLSEEEKYRLIMDGIVDYGKLQPDEESKVDCIMVLGCTPRPLKARVVKAVQLYKKGYAPFIIFSGGYGWNRKVKEGTPRDTSLISAARETIEEEFLEGEEDADIRNLTESEIMYKMAKGFDIPARSIIFEPFSNTTLENIKFTKYTLKKLEEEGIVTANSIMIVTSSFHCRRAELTFRKAFLGMDISSCPATLDLEKKGLNFETMRENPYYKEQIHREVDALINYSRNGTLLDIKVDSFFKKEDPNRE